jgi:hypothetical protein
MKNKLTPPVMGWSSWNYFRQTINETIILETARALKKSGLADLGYRYVNLDDCWQSSTRDAQGNLQFDLSNFPHGKKFVTILHQFNLKVGLYSSCGRLTCEDLPASYGYEDRDAKTFVDIGIDYLKYDYCHVKDLQSDEAWLPKAPSIESLELTTKDFSKTYQLKASSATLFGKATLQVDGSLKELPYIEGLNYNQGSFSFTEITIPPGEYIVTIVYRKQKTEERLLLTLDFNDLQKVIHFPTSSGWSMTGREQFMITFKEPITEISAKNPVDDQRSDAILRYRTMHDALKRAIHDSSSIQKEIVFSACEHGRNQPWLWAPEFAQTYRIFPDITNDWESVMMCYDQAIRVSAYSKEGSYADPDMLEVGNGQLSPNENRAHFSLWCFLSAPLILGNDIRNYEKQPTEDSLTVLSNLELIHINQTRPYLPAKRIQHGTIDILVKYLIDGTVALCFLNRSENEELVCFNLNKLPKKVHNIPFPSKLMHAQAIELWNSFDYEQKNEILTFKLAPHAVKVFKLS